MRTSRTRLLAILSFGLVAALPFPFRRDLTDEEIAAIVECMTFDELRQYPNMHRWYPLEDYLQPTTFSHEERLARALFCIGPPSCYVAGDIDYVVVTPEVFVPYLERMAAAIDFRDSHGTWFTYFFRDEDELNHPTGVDYHFEERPGNGAKGASAILQLLGGMRWPDANRGIVDVFRRAVSFGLEEEREDDTWLRIARSAAYSLPAREPSFDEFVRTNAERMPPALLESVIRHYGAVAPCDPELDRLFRAWIRQGIPAVEDSKVRARLVHYFERVHP